MDEIKVTIRDAKPADRNFILSTWLKGNYFGTHLRDMPQDLYYEKYADKIHEVLAMDGAQISIACDDLNPSWIVGFAAFKEPTLFWVHVKRDYRNKGIASLLIKNKDIKEVKALTRIGRSIALNKGLIFNPL